MCKFNIKDILQKDVCAVMETVYQNYEMIVSIFIEMQSECHDAYPFVSFESLREFCEKTGVIEPQMLDETIIEPDEDEIKKPIKGKKLV